jgi:hypothetical protein
MNHLQLGARGVWRSANAALQKPQVRTPTTITLRVGELYLEKEILQGVIL